MAQHGSPYRGRPRDRSLEGVIVPAFGRAQDWTQPWEDPDDGCPGAWYRTPYVDSVDEFTRERDDVGNRVSNPKFDRAPPQVQAAVLHLESEQRRARAYLDKAIADRLAAKTKAPATNAGVTRRRR